MTETRANPVTSIRKIRMGAQADSIRNPRNKRSVNDFDEESNSRL